MDPEAIDALLLNLKLQLLALPAQARWGLMAFAGVIVLREVITIAWNARQRRLVGGPAGLAKTPSEAPPAHSSTSDARTMDPAALPAPDPFVNVQFQDAEAQKAGPTTPPSGRRA